MFKPLVSLAKNDDYNLKLAFFKQNAYHKRANNPAYLPIRCLKPLPKIPYIRRIAFGRNRELP
jgi:hypothetical protein